MEPVRDHHKKFYSNLFLVKNIDGGRRLVINLSGFDHYIKKKPSRMATPKDVFLSLRQGDHRPKGCIFACSHCKRKQTIPAFLLVGGAEPVQKATVRLQLCPPPKPPPPRTFTWVTLPLVTLCKTQGIRIIVYLDDFLVLGRSRGELRSHTGFVLYVLKKVGFQKCNLEPRQEFLNRGLAWNTKNPTSLFAGTQEDRLQ